MGMSVALNKQKAKSNWAPLCLDLPLLVVLPLLLLPSAFLAVAATSTVALDDGADAAFEDRATAGDAATSTLALGKHYEPQTRA
jgi:hypothetical protein